MKTRMNALELIRTGILKTNRLNDAQFLMAKTYRGVPDVDAHDDAPQQGSETETKELTTRGQSNQH